MPKCGFNKAANQLYLNHTLAWVLSCKFAAIFKTSFTKNTSGWLLLKHSFFSQLFEEGDFKPRGDLKGENI